MTCFGKHKEIFYNHIHRRPVINAVGCAVFGVCFGTVLFANMALAHVTSDTDVFMDQVEIQNILESLRTF